MPVTIFGGQVEIGIVNQPSLLEELSELARERSGERRRDLLRGLTDLFDSGTAETKSASGDLFGDVVSRVLDEVAVEIRAEVSERLSKIEHSPRKLMLQLAQDDISVASPVLRSSDALTDDDLVHIANNHSQDHLLAISDRKTLTEQVTDALVEKGDQAVLHNVTDNQGARFSELGFNKLAKRASDDRQLQEKLVERRDLTASAADELRPFLAEQLKERLDAAGIDAKNADISRLVSTTAHRVQSEMQDAQRSRFEIRVLTSEIKQGKRPLDDTIIMLCRNDRALDVALLIRNLSDAGDIDVAKIMFREEGGPIAILCKNLGVEIEAFTAIAGLRHKRLKRSATETQKEIHLYSQLAETEAQRAIRFLKVRRAAG